MAGMERSRKLEKRKGVGAMDVQVLLSAMFLEDYRFIKELRITGDCVVINQCDREKKEIIEEESGRVSYIETRQRGLSKSRNMAVSEAWGEVCILCDNDVEYVENYREIIANAFERHPDADLIVFYIRRKERPSPLWDRDKKMGYLSTMKIFSPEIAFRRERIEGLSFDERFGAGAEYAMGEENIFLFGALKKGLKIWYVPERIAGLKETESTWFTGYTDKFFRDRGANYRAMSRGFSLFLILQFALRKYGIYRKDNTFWHALSCMLRGRKEFMRR